MNWLSHVTGFDGGSFAALWGGLIGDVGLFGGAAALYWKHTCHVSTCWRISRHPVAGTPYIVCRKHHPTIDAPPTAEDVHAAHLDATERAR